MAGNSPFHGLIRAFLNHRIAANLLAITLVVAGLLAVTRINTQFFPTIEVPVITISYTWPGASPQDLSDSVFEVVEPEIRFLDGIDNVTSYAVAGVGRITIEFFDGTDMDKALTDVQQAVDNITTLPADVERPVVTRARFYETVAFAAVSGDLPEQTLKSYAKDIRQTLLDRGIDRVTFTGRRADEIWVELRPDALRQLDLHVRDVSDRIAQASRNEPLGTLEGEVERQLRQTGRETTAEGLGGIAVRSLETGQSVQLRDIATLRETVATGGTRVFRDGKPAILLDIQRAVNADTLRSMQTAEQVVAQAQARLPAGVRVELFDVRSKVVDQRIDTLVANALQGFTLVIIILLIFLNARVAFWVAVGVPISMLATLALMFATGQTLNAISLLALILVLGIIVDDAIVVGEQTVTYTEQGMSPHEAAEKAAGRMLWPVLASTTTTQAAFFPIFLIGGTIGQVLIAIPLVVIVALCASTLECFLSLPSHLKHALTNMRKPVGPVRARLRAFGKAFRSRLDFGIDILRFRMIAPVVRLCYRWRYATVAGAVGALILSIGLLAGGRVGFTFFPTPEPETVFANLTFAPGMPEQRMFEGLREVEAAMARVAAASKAETGEDILVMVFGQIGQAGTLRGENLARVEVELTPGELRTLRTSDVIARWRKEIGTIVGLEQISVLGRRSGPPGFDLDVRLTGRTQADLKAIALDLQEQMRRVPGVFGIADDLPFGRGDVLMQVNPRGKALGFTTQEVARQVRFAYQGAVAQRFARGDEEVTVRVRLQGREAGRAGLEHLTLRTPAGGEVRLSQVVDIREAPAFSVVQRRDGKLTVAVTANVNSDVITGDEAQGVIANQMLPALRAKYGDFGAEFRGRAETQARAFADLRIGSIVALGLIFIILAFMLQNYLQPVLIMLMIPFGLIGAILGHWLMDFQMALLSLIGMLGLSGILVNNSIVLIDRFNERLAEGEAVETAAPGAAIDRVRAALLTSLTTIGGMAPLLFEQSLQAQFLIPIAITLSFGLGVVTVLVLFVQPALLGIAEDIRRGLVWYAERAGWRAPPRQPAE
jgi:multidrug efflux pump subunit AcrB